MKAKNNPQPKFKDYNNLSNEDLISLYEKRWQQIQSLNDLDQRTVVLVITAITGAVLSSPSVANLFVSMQTALTILASIICIGGIYSIVRNRVSMEYPLFVIDFIEVILEHRQAGIFSYAGQYKAPANLRDFARRILFSIRGPFILFFCAALIILVSQILFTVLPFFLMMQPNQTRLSSMGISLFGTALFLWWCMANNWKKAKANFEIMNQSRHIKS